MFSTILAAALVCQVPTAPSGTPDQSTYFASILNYQRQIRGLRPVGVDPNAYNTAYQNNLYQLSYGLGHHFLNNMSQCSAIGQPDPVTVLNAWAASPGHAAIIFDPNLAYIGFSALSGAYTLSGMNYYGR